MLLRELTTGHICGAKGILDMKRFDETYNLKRIHDSKNYLRNFWNHKEKKANILGLEFQFPFMKPDDLYHCFGNSIIFVPILSFKGRDEYPKVIDFIKYMCTEKFKDMRRFFILNLNDDEDIIVESEYLECKI